MIVQVISPMWPSPESPHTGIFVQNLCDRLEAEGLRVDPVALVRGKGRGALGKARAHLGLGSGLARAARAPADLVYAHAPTWFAPLLRPLARGAPLVVHTHGGEVYPHSRVEAAARGAVGAACRAADLVVCPSRYYAGEVEAAFGVAPERLFVSPSGGVDTALFTPGDRAAARRRLGLPAEAAIFGYVGRLEDDKGLDVLVHALARVEGAVGLMVGRGGAQPGLLSLAHARGVRLEHRPLVPQSELPNAYRAMDAFVFPTRRGAEALGLVPIEALACGVPVIGSDRYAVPEYVTPGETGWLAPPRDVAAFAAAMRALVQTDPDGRAALSAAARRAAEPYDAAVTARALAARLRALVAARRA